DAQGHRGEGTACQAGQGTGRAHCRAAADQGRGPASDRRGDPAGAPGRPTVKVVLDASVAIKWVIRDPGTEPHLDKALALLQAIRTRRIEAVEPLHWTIEILAVIARMRPRRVDFVL